MAFQILEIECLIMRFGKKEKHRTKKWYYIAIVDKFIK